MLTLSLQRLYKLSRLGVILQRTLILSRALPALQFAIKIESARVKTLGRGAMAAHRTLDPWILVRIQAPQPIGRQ